MFVTVEQVKQIVNSLLDKQGRGGFLTGTVSSINPMKIRINSRLELSAASLYITDSCIGIDIISENGRGTVREPLKVGDGVLLLCRPATLDGTKYIILDRIQEYKEKRTVNV